MDKLIKRIYEIRLYTTNSFDYETNYPNIDDASIIEKINNKDIGIISCNPLLIYKSFQDLNQHVDDKDLIEVSCKDIAVTKKQFIELIKKPILTIEDYEEYVIKDTYRVIAYKFSYESNIDSDYSELIEEVLYDQMNIINLETLCEMANVNYANLLKFKASRNGLDIQYKDARNLMNMLTKVIIGEFD